MYRGKYVGRGRNAACAGRRTASAAGDSGDPAYLLHVETCELTIAKTGGKAGEHYVFKIQKGNAAYMKVTVLVGAGAATGSVTIKELPVGTYTVEEDTNWSWHYTASCTGGNSATLSATNPMAALACANTAKTDVRWFNAYGRAVNTHE